MPPSPIDTARNAFFINMTCSGVSGPCQTCYNKVYCQATCRDSTGEFGWRVSYVGPCNNNRQERHVQCIWQAQRVDPASQPGYNCRQPKPDCTVWSSTDPPTSAPATDPSRRQRSHRVRTHCPATMRGPAHSHAPMVPLTAGSGARGRQRRWRQRRRERMVRHGTVRRSGGGGRAAGCCGLCGVVAQAA